MTHFSQLALFLSQSLELGFILGKCFSKLLILLCENSKFLFLKLLDFFLASLFQLRLVYLNMSKLFTLFSKFLLFLIVLLLIIVFFFLNTFNFLVYLLVVLVVFYIQRSCQLLDFSQLLFFHLTHFGLILEQFTTHFEHCFIFLSILV